MGRVGLEKKMQLIEMSQKMSQPEITKEPGIAWHAVQVTQKKHDEVGSV